jgi:hypothetical protein
MHARTYNVRIIRGQKGGEGEGEGKDRCVPGRRTA